MKNGFKNLLVECSGKQGWNGAAPVIGLCKMRRTREYIYSVGLAGGEGRGSANSRKKKTGQYLWRKKVTEKWRDISIHS